MLIITGPTTVSAYEQIVAAAEMSAVRHEVLNKIGPFVFERSKVQVTIVKEQNYYQDTEEYCLTCRKANHRAPTLQAAADWIVALVTLEA